MALGRGRLSKSGVTVVQEMTRGAHQGPEMGAGVRGVCVGGVEKG